MPASVQVTYPGVYIQEIPSGNVTITGVATSITAFVGRTIMGPSEPIHCFNFADFERYFGGRAYGYPLGYAVEDFFQNGGSHAVIARVFAASDATSTGVATATLSVGGTSVTLNAASAGSWGNKIVATIDTNGITADVANRFVRYGQGKGDDAKNKAAQDSVKDAAAKAAALKDAQATLARLTAAKKDLDTKTQAATVAAAALAAAQKGGDATGIQQAQAAKDAADAALKVLTDAQTDHANKVNAAQQAEAAYNTAEQGTDDAAKTSAKAAWDAAVQAANDAAAKAPPSAADVTAAQTAVTNAQTAAANAAKAKSDAASAAAADQIKDFFNLTLTYTKPDGQKVIERYASVTVVDTPAPNRLDRVLSAQSLLAQVAPDQTWIAASATQRSPSAGTVAFANGADSRDLTAEDLTGDQAERTGIYALDDVDIFNLLCIPPDPADADYGQLETLYQAAAVYCQKRRAMLILDPPKAWSEAARKGEFDQIQPTDLGISGPELESRNCAVYFPPIRKVDPETGVIGTFPACGAIAGIMATTDSLRGVWKAPAGVTAGIGGITALDCSLTDDQNGMLNAVGINCLRNFPIIGPIVWGTRTLRGADLLSDDYKYVPVRRLTLYIEESLYRGTKFAVFEPNDETLWSQLRLSIGAFMADLARQGAFYSYAVACDKSTTTQYDIDRGIVNVHVGFAPVKPAEFIVLQIQQQAGQTGS